MGISPACASRQAPVKLLLWVKLSRRVSRHIEQRLARPESLTVVTSELLHLLDESMRAVSVHPAERPAREWRETQAEHSSHVAFQLNYELQINASPV